MRNIVQPKIIRVTYSIRVNEEIINKCRMRFPNRIFNQLKIKIPDVYKMNYPKDSPDILEISFNTNNIKKYDPKYNIKIWQNIAKIIENIIE